jgi:hypothetical protein
MLFTEIIAVYYENETGLVSTPSGQNADFLGDKANGAFKG